ncbi:hypothetical protein PXH69_33630 [Rhodococcus qingshengii]|uniref:Uncharacterized protein n=1 Tax=Rhodococcus qingshengii TaxID=334542 RepID=A0AAW6LRV8_RHOSG|nr:hypothetical protein [Rhodococcus qingshengii]MDE8649908.1 hypothetical protein [Rhodococcus qingshengii]
MTEADAGSKYEVMGWLHATARMPPASVQKATNKFGCCTDMFTHHRSGAIDIAVDYCVNNFTVLLVRMIESGPHEGNHSQQVFVEDELDVGYCFDQRMTSAQIGDIAMEVAIGPPEVSSASLDCSGTISQSFLLSAGKVSARREAGRAGLQHRPEQQHVEQASAHLVGKQRRVNDSVGWLPNDDATAGTPALSAHVASLLESADHRT